MKTFTKTIIITYTVTSIVWITWSYMLATYAMIILSNIEPMSSLSEKVCDVIIGYIIVYCLKAFFETFAEKGMELIERHINKDIESQEYIDSINKIVNDKLKEYEDIQIIMHDIQYQEGIIEALEIENKIREKHKNQNDVVGIYVHPMATFYMLEEIDDLYKELKEYYEEMEENTNEN